MTLSEMKNFIGYLRNCTDNQILGVYEKEKQAHRWEEVELAKLEAARRGLNFTY